uniref:Uncharacterized protein n=1 Tax=Panagrolaimus davidi TaxID=227884 RepID=A0A914PUZ6_9BILA
MKQPDAVVLVTGDKFVNNPDAIPDEYDESPTVYQTPTPNPSSKEEALPTAPTSPSKATLRQLTAPQCNEMEEIRQVQQKLLQQQEDLRRKQEEIQTPSASNHQNGSNDAEALLYNSSSTPRLSLSTRKSNNDPSFHVTPPRQKLVFFSSINFSQYESATLSETSSMVLVNTLSPQINVSVPPLEEQQQPLRQQSPSNDGAADVPQPLPPQAIATPSVYITSNANFPPKL